MSTLFCETFGEKVKAMRHKVGMDQETLAKLTFTSRFLISSLENGKKIPTSDERKLIASAFGMEEVFFIDTNLRDLETEQLLSHAKALSPDTLHKVNNLIEVIVDGKK